MHTQSIFKANESKEKQEAAASIKDSLKEESEKNRQKIIAGIEESAAELRQELLEKNPNFSAEKVEKTLEEEKQRVIAAQLAKYDKNAEKIIEGIVSQSLKNILCKRPSH